MNKFVKSTYKKPARPKIGETIITTKYYNQSAFFVIRKLSNGRLVFFPRDTCFKSLGAAKKAAETISNVDESVLKLMIKHK